MNTTPTTTTTTTTPFPPGLMDAIIVQLPHEIRINMFLNWAWEFAINGPKHLSNIGLVELFKSITKLDFSHYFGINTRMDSYNEHLDDHIGDRGCVDDCEFCGHGLDADEKENKDGLVPFPHFGHLIHLPFSSALAHLNLSKTPIGHSSEFMNTLSHPIFQHLVTLDLSYTNLKNVDPLFNAAHPFPNLHTLNLSNNAWLSIPRIATTTQFPNLKVLDMTRTRIGETLQSFSSFSNLPQPPSRSTPSLLGRSTARTSTTPPTTTTITTPLSSQPSPFQLEKLVLSDIWSSDFLTLSRSPHVSQLKELYVRPFNCSSHTIRELFDPEPSMLKNLTHLDIGSLDPSEFQALGESPLLSNLISLRLCAEPPPPGDLSDGEIQRREQSLQQFLHSPFLWTSKLKHLSLTDYPTTFDDFIPTLNAANIKLETLNLSGTPSTFDQFLTAPCLSELKEFKFYHDELDPQPSPEQFLQLPFLSNLQHFPFPLRRLDPNDLVTIFSSPMMSNNLIELDFSNYRYPLQDLIKTICTTRINPTDETSPLKYGKLRKLDLSLTDVTDDDIQFIVENLTELTHLSLGGSPGRRRHLITNQTITALLATECAEPYHPYTTLPNLIHLDLHSSGITHAGIIQLSKSQLFSQLEELDVGDCHGQRGDEGRQSPPGLFALLKNSHISNLKTLGLHSFMFEHIEVLMKKLHPDLFTKHFQHLSNYCRMDY